MSRPGGHRLQLALFGDPVKHSLSPRIHAAFAGAAEIDLDYRLIRSTPLDLADRFSEFIAGGGRGANFTVPVKTAAVSLAGQLTPGAERAGAINTLYLDGAAWIGDNTDGPGLVTDLRRLGLDPAGRRILVIGAGGTVTGILAPLLAAGVTGIAINNRTPERASALVDRFGDDRLATVDRITGRWDLVLQATSLGHHGAAPDLTGLAAGASVYDLNYGPAHAPLARHCRDLDLPCHDGLGMLVEQARLAFERFAGLRAGDATCRAILAKLRETSEIRDSGLGTRNPS